MNEAKMSAAIMMRQKDAIHLMVDAACYFPDGVIAGFMNKTAAFPELRCAVTTLGASCWLVQRLLPLVHGILDEHFGLPPSAEKAE